MFAPPAEATVSSVAGDDGTAECKCDMSRPRIRWPLHVSFRSPPADVT